MALYRQLLGERYALLPASVQRLHEPKPSWRASGRCEVRRGSNALARLLGVLMGFPPAGSDVPLRFEIELRGGTEHWRRCFGERQLRSTFQVHGERLRERMGPLCLEQSLEWRPAEGLHLIPCRAWFLGIPLPGLLVPRVRAVASEEQGRYCFDVAAALPWAGEVLRYRGWLQVEGVR